MVYVAVPLRPVSPHCPRLAAQELLVAQDELAKVKQAARSDVRQLQLELVSCGRARCCAVATLGVCWWMSWVGVLLPAEWGSGRRLWVLAKCALAG